MKGHKQTGARVGKLPNRKGWYILWYESRSRREKVNVEADPAHRLSLAPHAKGGLVVVEDPNPSSPYHTQISKGDIVYRVGTEKVNTPKEFVAALSKQKGVIIGIRVNKGGLTGGVLRAEKAGETREMADKCLARWIQNKDRKAAGLDPILDKVRFTDLVDGFLKWARTSASGYSPQWLVQIENIMKHHSQRWKDLNVNEITPIVLRKWFDEFAGRVAAGTAANAVKPLRKCFARAIELGYIKDDPTAVLTTTQPRQTTPKYLSLEQIETLVQCAKMHDASRLVPPTAPRSGVILAPKTMANMRSYYNANGTFDAARVNFLLLTGLRKSQLTSLTWKQYDPQRGTITLESSAQHTEKSKRVTVIPLPDAARRIIEGQPQNSNYVFPNLEGGHDVQIGSRFARIAKLYGARGGGKVHLHMLRHTALTHLLAKTGDIAAVQAYAGHSDVRMTQRYAHILPSKLAAITRDFSFEPSVEQQNIH